MGRRNVPQTLTLERFIAGKNGQATAFKKRKQANKQKLIRKARLKREYSKVLKREGVHDPDQRDDHDDTTEREDTSGQAHERALHTWTARTENRVEKTEIATGETREVDSANTLEPNQHPGVRDGLKRKRANRRPDPFREAKAKAEQRRREAEEKQLERARLAAEKEERVRKRKRQHALLSKRTKGGQPVMKHTMQHLLEKIKAQT